MAGKNGFDRCIFRKQFAIRGKIAIKNSQVTAVFEAYPPNIQAKLMFLRQLIFETAASIDGVGEVEETLKWSVFQGAS